jgi:hypothetical protein
MAYNKSKLEETALKEIKDRKLIFIEDIVCYLPCTRKTFYEHELHKSHAIKDALQLNKTDIKTSLRSKWYKSDNATLQIALMRLACNDEERRKLAVNYTEHSGDGGGAVEVDVYIMNNGQSIKMG